jgi:hypothetical protein
MESFDNWPAPMENFWLPLFIAILSMVGALIGVIVGGTITSAAKWVELRQQARINERRLHAEKLEELLRLVTQRIIQASGFCYILLRASHSNLDGFAAADLTNELRTSMQESDMTINGFVRAYAPSLLENCSDLLSRHSEFADFVEAAFTGEFDVQGLRNQTMSHIGDCMDLQEEIAKQIRNNFKYSLERHEFKIN